MLAMFMGFSLYASSLQLKAFHIKKRLARFTEYENSIREKWGDHAIEEFVAPQRDE